MIDNTAGPVLVERFGAVAEVVLNRPARRNALTATSIASLRDVFSALAVSDAGAVLLRGAEGFFCSGLDLDEVDPSTLSLPVWGAVHQALSDLEIPVVACLEGGAINAGAALALASDLIVAGEHAYLQMTEAAMGVPMPMNAAWLALRYPPAVGMQLALSCRRFKGPDLRRLGIALDVTADEEVLDHARRLASDIASYPAWAGRSTKQSLRLARGDAGGFASAVAAATGSGGERS
ncbi:enoyl-CoA hydratase/isomerase family protein [Acidiferrimicrobium sp. IK]|uniref:enoyl-CoA hydratase/isomerase family protein n=1 Tax=Acidiferrimicrobium sp. IK TaxID=2871700 RepID=UPI0021CAEA89|nr:enoyl-CoA hydratase/isomerase family protein [Acidiferrimicrobium sp. IK]MCU4185251.1 enoyl-CoA hydratase/isomerase family protein [Acidiferrimicrobium sp. IK]